MNAGKTCWYNCGGEQGKCSWCGSDGWCCRKNGNSPYWLPTAQTNGCDGTFGGPTQHQCVLKPCSGLAAGTGKSFSEALIYFSINPKYSIALLGRFPLIIHQNYVNFTQIALPT